VPAFDYQSSVLGWSGVLGTSEANGAIHRSILGSRVHRKPHQLTCQQETASEMRLKSTRANLVCAPKLEGHTAGRFDDHDDGVGWPTTCGRLTSVQRVEGG